MEVEARSVERAVVGMTIGGFEVAGVLESGGVPEATTEISEKGQLRPELRDLPDEDGVLVDGP